MNRVWRAQDMESFRQERSGGFYRAALCYAQSLWLEGKPAQALLQLNKAFSADLIGNEAVLGEWRPPYEAKAWIIRENRAGEWFMGNPVRHYQHLASRMNSVNPVPRCWRAWACFHMAERILGPEYERDFRQIEQEKLRIPEVDEIAAGLAENGWPGEREVWMRCFQSLVNGGARLC